MKAEKDRILFFNLQYQETKGCFSRFKRRIELLLAERREAVIMAKEVVKNAYAIRLLDEIERDVKILLKRLDRVNEKLSKIAAITSLETAVSDLLQWREVNDDLKKSLADSALKWTRYDKEVMNFL